MKSLLLLSALFFSTLSIAQDTKALLSSVGKVYTRTQGQCAAHVDIMRWFDYDTSGTITFALTNTPMIRPLSGYSISATTKAQEIYPLGSGIFEMQPNQYVPIKSEYSVEANGDLNLFFHHKGKGSLGGIIFEAPSYSKQNHKFEFFFADKNAEGVFQTLTYTYQDLKGLIPKKKVVCSFKLEM